LAELEKNPPANQIDSGKINGDFYENAMLGFSYRIPEGWVLEPNGAVQPAIERYRTKTDFGRPRISRVEKSVMDACSKTLFSAWAKRPGADGQISYDDFGEVTVSAAAASCFLTTKFPKDSNDAQAFKDFVGQLALTHPIVEDMGKGKVFTENGITFLYLHGTVAFQIPNEELSRRLSLALAITERRGYLLMWFFAAPHDSELEGLTDQRAIFDRNPPVAVASSSQPAGAAKGSTSTDPASFDAADTLQSASQASTSGSQSTSGPSAAAPPPASSTTAPTPADQQGKPPASESGRPTLLRPGETMNTQQGKGVVIKPK
jgi:hypothetical protein